MFVQNEILYYEFPGMPTGEKCPNHGVWGLIYVLSPPSFKQQEKKKKVQSLGDARLTPT